MSDIRSVFVWWMYLTSRRRFHIVHVCGTSRPARTTGRETIWSCLSCYPFTQVRGKSFKWLYNFKISYLCPVWQLQMICSSYFHNLGFCGNKHKKCTRASQNTKIVSLHMQKHKVNMFQKCTHRRTWDNAESSPGATKAAVFILIR
jgi:hypothetical protein